MILSTRINGNNTKCDKCEGLFYRSPAHLSRTKLHFCCRKCSSTYQTGLNHARGTWQSLPRPCETCGKEIEKRGKRRFCSRACVVVKPRRRRIVNCDKCNKPLQRIEALIHKTNFCSKICQNSYHSERLKGTKNPRYKHGDWLGSAKKQHLNYRGFTKARREAVRERDGNKCIVCDMSAETHGSNMHVHHIDYNKLNNKLHNLVSVCKYCHGKIHGNEKKWLKIMLKVSDGLKNYPRQLTIFA